MIRPTLNSTDTPITDAVIAAADANPETRLVFLIKSLANLAKRFERQLGNSAGTIKCEWQDDFECQDSCCIADQKCNYPLTGPLSKEKP